MGLEFNIKSVNLLEDIEAELSKKLNLKISFDGEDENLCENTDENENICKKIKKLLNKV